MTMIYLLDLFGVAVFAISGSLVAGEKRLDIFGVVVVALATALGGGTLRDLILNIRPLFWLADANYLFVGVGASALTFALAHFRRPPGGLLLVADALGLAAFTVIGAQRSLHASPLVAVIMGVMTAVVGGMIRDILCGQIPLILRREVYATASLCGAVAYVALACGVPALRLSAFVGMTVTLALRLAAIRWKLSLPLFPQRAGDRKGR